MTSVDSNFNLLCGRPHGAGPPPPSICVHVSLTPSPLRVDVINGWPLSIKMHSLRHVSVRRGPGRNDSWGPSNNDGMIRLKLSTCKLQLLAMLNKFYVILPRN